ncbi:Spermidine Putrescine ABC transporter permease component PotB [Clostridiaceae bacterium JG1575]|nr:Spermidine Putrescine ABC transporter permease component PotB [Clostridiaceae bacterium JG1575]
MRMLKRTAGPYLLWALVFVLASLIMVLYYGFTDGQGRGTFAQFSRFLSGAGLGTLWRSLRIAALTTLLCFLIGYPLAALIAGMRTRYQTTAILLVIIPMWMNFLLRTYAWVTILSKNGILNQLLARVGLGPLDLLYTEGAVLLGMVYNFLPFMVLPIYTVLTKMDSSLIEAAEDLGSSKWQTFLRVVFPLSLPGVASGVAMVFIPAISTFEITALLGGNKTNLIGNVIEQQFTVTGDWNYGSAMSVVLMVFLLVTLFFAKEESGDPQKAPKSARSKGREHPAGVLISGGGGAP